MSDVQTAEQARLDADATRAANWKRWGPYLPERQWATVREDYSPDGANWSSFPYEHSLARAYRWGEDGLLGWCDRECRLCFAVSLWNGRDPHLKERLFGLTNPEGNHGEDVKEAYFYLDAVPTFSYAKALYKYPQAAFPYAALREAARSRGRHLPEYELTDTGVFDGDRYWDVFVEYAKAGENDTLVRVTIHNRGPEPATLHVLPTVWFRNTWSWGGRYDEAEWTRPTLTLAGGRLRARHQTLGAFTLDTEDAPLEWLFTENESNPEVFGLPAGTGAYKDAFHRHVVSGEKLTGQPVGTKAAARYAPTVPAGGSVTMRFRLAENDGPADRFGDFDATFARRIAEADGFYAAKIPARLSDCERATSRQAYAGLLWSEQFYHYVVPDWVNGDPPHPTDERTREGRANRAWAHLFSRDVLSVPDKWEYPAFFSWDTAFHMVPMARIDPHFAKHQLLLLLREWYLHPNGQLPAYEYELSNVTPPVHAWACWRVYQIDGGRDREFLERVFHKLLLNFTWWVNRKDAEGRGIFGGGFLGLDNIGVFDRSQPLPNGAELQQADGTAWMGAYAVQMLRIALELAYHNRSYEDVASKFLEHFIAVGDALNHLDGAGLWDEHDGFFYDRVLCHGHARPLKVRSLVGFVPLLAVLMLEERKIHPALPDFEKRMFWFFKFRADDLAATRWIEEQGESPNRRRLLVLACRKRLTRMLERMFDEAEFLSPFGVRSLSKVHESEPYVFRYGGDERVVRYLPGESDSGDFGGNSNWRGPVWVPLNFLFVEALMDYHEFLGDDFTVELPRGSGRRLTLAEAARELARRLASLVLPDAGGARPCHGGDRRWADDPHWRDLALFHEHFDGDTGRGLGASHQTGWTALLATLLERCAGAP